MLGLAFEPERTGKTKMGTRLDSGNGAATEVQETRRMKTSRVKKQRIPRWGIFLFVILAAFAVARTLQRGVETAKTTQPPVRPVLVAKVISKDVPLYLDEIGTCAAYETVQVQAQVSGQIIARHFQDGADVKKGDLLFTIDPRPYQAALEQAQAQATLDQITMKRQQELRARNVISPQDLDTAQANAHKSEAAAAAARRLVFHRQCSPARFGNRESARSDAKSGPRVLAVGICACSFHSRYRERCATGSFASGADQSKWA